MATGTIKTPIPILFRNVQRTVSQSATDDFWNMQVEFPPKTGYSRQIVALSSDNSNVLVTGWIYADDNPLMPRWQTHKLTSGTLSVTLYACLMYLPDVNAWS